MNHRKVLFVLLPIICLSISVLVQFNVKASPTTIQVPLDYPTIQEAINHANPGDTVSVSAGTYQECLYIDKNLTLTGANRDSTIINCTGGWCGIEVNSSSVTITGFTVVNATLGIYVYESSGCIVSDNSITTPHTNITQEVGIWLYASNSSVVSDNIVYNVGWRGIVLCGYSSENTITLNTVSDCGSGIAVSGEGNFIYHNNFVGNQIQTEMLDSFHNDWNDTYEGNYWSDYNGTDGDKDGIGDTPYLIDANNQDDHPLMGMFYQFEITEQEQTYTIAAICNSTITDFTYDGAINFNTTGPEGTEGFCRIMIPTAIFDHNYTILVDGSPPLEQNELPISNSTETYVYFTFTNTTHGITIIPEFPTTILLALIILSIPTAIALKKRKQKNKTEDKPQK
jgi:parallel beta-helix repeat protein